MDDLALRDVQGRHRAGQRGADAAGGAGAALMLGLRLRLRLRLGGLARLVMGFGHRSVMLVLVLRLMPLALR
jgi:hypothetical protein